MRDDLLIHRAARWLRRLQPGSYAERLEFCRWMKQSPDHVRAVLLASAWLEESNRLPPAAAHSGVPTFTARTRLTVHNAAGPDVSRPPLPKDASRDRQQ